MITFHVLGTLGLQGPDGRHLGSAVSGSKRLALLAYLALAGARVARRDTLLGLLWPELDQKHARNSLSNMLHQLRRSLGSEVVLARGNEDIGLNDGAMWCDATAFQEAVDDHRFVDALDLYRGDLLEGFFVAGASTDFDQWLNAERVRLRRSAVEAARSLVDRREAAGDTADAIRWARRASTIDPDDEVVARRLIALLAGAGDRAGALRTYEELAARLAREFDAEPAAETRTAIDAIRGRGNSTAAGAAVLGGATVAHGSVSPDRPSIRSVAVLPFENLTGAEAGEPFAAGLHDDLLTELSKIASLSVIARTSVLRYRGTLKSVTEIARELGVGTIVEGGVQTVGGRIRLNVQLIDAQTGAHRWGERFDRTLSMDSTLELQSELAEKIAQAVRGKLTPAERERLGRPPTAHLEAFRLHAEGRRSLDLRTESTIRRALEHFQSAVAIDPGYALAWTGIADALSILHDYGFEDADSIFPRAEAAVQRALELDPNLAEAHASLSAVHGIPGHRYLVDRHLRRAVELRPSYAEAHNWLSWNCMVLGDAVQALASARRAVELDPLSPEAVSNFSLSSLLNGDAATALREARRARELHPAWTTGSFYEALALYHLGRHTEATHLLRDLTVEWAGSGPLVTLALAYVATGDRARADELRRAFDREGDPYASGLVHLAQGNQDRAFDAFRRVDRWIYWPALSLRHLYPHVLGPLRANALHAQMRQAMEHSWREERGAPTSAERA